MEAEEEENAEEDASVSASCDLSALGTSPPPVVKKAWKEMALMKKPSAAAAEVQKKPSASSSVVAGAKKFKKALAKGMKEDKTKVLVHQDSLSIGGGKNQAYLQHVPGPGKNKRLLAAVTAHQASSTTLTHKELVEHLLPFAKKKGATKADVIRARDSLLQKHAK